MRSLWKNNGNGSYEKQDTPVLSVKLEEKTIDDDILDDNIEAVNDKIINDLETKNSEMQEHNEADDKKIAAMEARISAAKAALRSAKGGRFPTVNAFGSYQYDEGWRRPGNGDNWTAGVSVDLNLFDGQRTTSQVFKAQTNLLIAQEELRKLRLNIILDIQEAKLTYERAKLRINVTAKSNEQAEESAQLSRARFEQGVILSSDLINIETRLTEAKMRRAIALADEQVALADLNRALGSSPFPSIKIP